MIDYKLGQEYSFTVAFSKVPPGIVRKKDQQESEIALWER